MHRINTATVGTAISVEMQDADRANILPAG